MATYEKRALCAMADEKLRDAQTLLDAGAFSNAYYLAGYAVELALKACIATQFRQDSIPDLRLVNAIYKHDLLALLNTANLALKLDERLKKDDNFAVNWAVARQWVVDSRYERTDAEAARQLVAAIADAEHGVLPWIKGFW